MIQAFEFSTISEDRLSLAVRMARKDLQKQKQELILEETREKAERQQKRGAKKKPCLYPAASSKQGGLVKRKDKAKVRLLYALEVTFKL